MEKISVGTFLKWKNSAGKDVYARVSGVCFKQSGGAIEKIWISCGRERKTWFPDFITPGALVHLGAERLEVQDILDELNR